MTEPAAASPWRTGRRQTLLLGGLASALVLGALGLFVRRHSGSLYDDAYIYFRFADNLVRGCGFRYNCGGEVVEGVTSPLWQLLLTTCRFFTTDLELAAQVAGTTCMGAALLLALALPLLDPEERGRGIGTWTAVFAGAAILAADDYLMLNAVSGMETALACAVAPLLLLALLRERRGPLAAVSIVAVLVRPEFALFIPFFLLCPWVRDARYLLRFGLALAAVVTLRLAIFQDILPNTYWAKSGGTLRHFQLGLEYLRGVLRDFPLIIAAPLGLVRLRGRRGAQAFLLGAAAWFLLFLRTGGDHFPYSRLAVPLVPALTMTGLSGATRLLGALAGRLRPAMRAAVVVALIAPALLLAGHLRSAGRSFREQHGLHNARHYAAAGRYLARAFPGKSFAAVPVGAMAYFSGLKVFDLVGLTERSVALSGNSVPAALLNRNWIGHERHNTPWILAQKPDLIVFATWRERSYEGLEEVHAGFYAEWLLLQEIKSGRAPYRLFSAPVGEREFWPIFVRTAEENGSRPGGTPGAEAVGGDVDNRN